MSGHGRPLSGYLHQVTSNPYENKMLERLKCIKLLWWWLIYNHPPKGRWIVVDIYRDAKRRGIYPPLFANPEGDSCFSIYQIRWIKKCHFINGHNFFFWTFAKRCVIFASIRNCLNCVHNCDDHGLLDFSLHSQNSEYPWIFQVTGANQNARKLLSTDLVNTKYFYSL